MDARADAYLDAVREVRRAMREPVPLRRLGRVVEAVRIARAAKVRP